MRRVGFAAAVAFVAVLAMCSGAFLMTVAPNASAYTPIEITLDTPTFAGTLQKVDCTLKVSGGPAVEYGTNYTYKAEIVADNTTGSSVSPSTGSAVSGVFNFTVTMPGEAQTIKVRINATSKGESAADNVYKVREFEVKVVAPIILTAVVYNTGSVDVENATAAFYADGILLGTEVFGVEAGESASVVHNWTWANIAEGEHTITVVIDDDLGLVEFSDGNNVYTKTIYVGTEGNPVGAILTVGVIIMSVMVALMIMAKPQKRKK